MEEKTINIITLGEAGVGKTSILNRIVNKTFYERELSTSTFNNFFLKRKYEKKNLNMILQFVDTIGQEKYASLPNSYMKDSHIVLLVFDSIETLNVIKERWYEYYKKNANVENSRFILIGNKSDLFEDERQEIIREGEKFSEEIDALFMTCSAKSADNIDNLERYIITEAKRFIDAEEKENKSKASPSINSSPNNKNIFNLENYNKNIYCTLMKHFRRYCW